MSERMSSSAILVEPNPTNREPQIPLALRSIEGRMERLREEIQVLAQRLEPVRRPLSSAGLKDVVSKNADGMAPLASILQELSHQIEREVENLSLIREEIEL